MYVERTRYFAKPGRAEDVLAARRRASRIRLEIGLPEGAIFVKTGEGDGPDVEWECAFPDLDSQRRDYEARGASVAFARVREDMGALLHRFERHVARRESPPQLFLDEVSLRPSEHTFRSRDAELFSYLYAPPGEGPFPAMVLNHGSGLTRGSTDVSKSSVASLLLSWGIACFVPHRRGYGRSPGPYWREEVPSPFGTDAYDVELVRRLHRESEDVIDALDALSRFPSVDPGRVGVMGSSFGGTVSLLAAAKCDRFRCAVDFAGAAMNWEKTARLRELMKQSAKSLEVPILLLQAENDYSTRPTRELAEVLESEGKTFEAHVFPPFGANEDEGHWFERAGSAVWGRRVRDFLARYL
jgi:dipeptidyl aminopeptidase/acylaminoacyl peptidase